jgi:hypothetical protein
MSPQPEKGRSMTTQPEVAVGNESPVELSPEDRLTAAFDDPQNIKEPEEDEEGEQPEAVEGAEDELTLEEEADDLPPIEAPVSLSAEDKETFKSLPRPAQEILAKRIGEAERGLHQKAQEAARARTEVEQEALRSLSAYEQQVAQHLQQYAQQLEVPKPDPSLLATDPTTYAYQMRQYEDVQAQRQAAQQQAAQFAQQAQQREQMAEQAYMAQQHQLIVEQFPEYADPTTGPKLQQELSAVARELGYPPELISQARATDIIAMRTAAEWKAKAAKYDALNAKKMEKVRAAKDLPRVAKPGTAQAPGAARQNQYASDREALRNGDQAATLRVLDSFFVKTK